MNDVNTDSEETNPMLEVVHGFTGMSEEERKAAMHERLAIIAGMGDEERRNMLGMLMKARMTLPPEGQEQIKKNMDEVVEGLPDEQRNAIKAALQAMMSHQ